MIESEFRKISRFYKSNLNYIWISFLYFFDYLNALRINPSNSLVVSGFWRSGTTWLQQYLAKVINAKSIWEPLFWKNFYKTSLRKNIKYHSKSLEELRYLALKYKSLNPFPIKWPKDNDLWALDVFMPYCDTDILRYPELYNLMLNALKGKVLSGKSLKLRFNLNDCFSSRVVVKVVRGHLCLRAIQNFFSCPIVHIFRDPRAVIASLKRIYWGKQWINRFLLKEQLIDPDDGRVEYFKDYAELIDNLDNSSAIARLTGYWALTEKFIQDSFKNSPGYILFLSYEKFCMDTEGYIRKIAKESGIIDDVQYNSLYFESVTTQKCRQGIDISNRIFGWKNELSISEIKTIESIAINLGYEDRLI